MPTLGGGGGKLRWREEEGGGLGLGGCKLCLAGWELGRYASPNLFREVSPTSPPPGSF